MSVRGSPGGHPARMRWVSLFADLEARFEAAEAADLLAEVRDRARAELARIRLVDRLHTAVGDRLAVRVRSGQQVSGRLGQVGADWLLLATEPAGEALVPLGAVVALRGPGSGAQEPGSEGRLAGRLDLRYALRGLARDRERLRLELADGTVLAGVLARVGADHVDLAEDPRAPGTSLVPLTAVDVVRSVSRGG